MPGWREKVSKTKLNKPVKTDDGVVTEEFGRITWRATSESNGIQPGEFRDFSLAVEISDVAGQKLTFKAVQT